MNKPYSTTLVVKTADLEIIRSLVSVSGALTGVQNTINCTNRPDIMKKYFVSVIAQHQEVLAELGRMLVTILGQNQERDKT